MQWKVRLQSAHSGSTTGTEARPCRLGDAEVTKGNCVVPMQATWLIGLIVMTAATTTSNRFNDTWGH
jgi:hypothetical protein